MHIFGIFFLAISNQRDRERQTDRDRAWKIKKREGIFEYEEKRKMLKLFFLKSQF